MHLNLWTDHTKETPLIMAARNGKDPSMAQSLLDYGAGTLAADQYGFTALHRAVACGHLDCAKALARAVQQRGESAAIMSGTGMCSAILHATVNSHTASLEYLASLGVDLHVQVYRGLPALSVACLVRPFQTDQACQPEAQRKPLMCIYGSELCFI